MEHTYRLYSSLTKLEQQKTWAEIDLNALRRNYRQLTDTVHAQNPSTRIIAVVKDDAYGHGAPECVRTLLLQGCDFFAVSCIDEAVAVRAVCDREKKSADVLILGYTQPSLASQLARFHIIQTLLSEDYARQLEEAAAAANVYVRTHISIDTGMNRIGFAAHSNEEMSDAADAIARVHTFSHLHIEGMFTHFARADEAPVSEGSNRTDLQAARYRRVCSLLDERGIQISFHHVCNSAASLLRPDDHFDGVRLGILLYGARPSSQIKLQPEPVMKLKTVISHVHKLLPGEAVSYGGTFTADSERLLATLPLGYGDGFLRAYSGAVVSVETEEGPRPATVVGRICMDQCMIDVTETGAQVGDVVTLFGNSPEQLSALADRADTIDYECLCLVSSRVTRQYVD